MAISSYSVNYAADLTADNDRQNLAAMENAREQAGTGSALLGAAGFLFGSIVSPLVGLGNILISTGITFICCAVGSCICGLIALHPKEPAACLQNEI